MDLKQELESKLEKVHITGSVGREGSFEVSVNDTVVFSKLSTYGFPYADDIVKVAQAAQNGDEVEPIKNSQSPCIIL